MLLLDRRSARANLPDQLQICLQTLILFKPVFDYLSLNGISQISKSSNNFGRHSRMILWRKVSKRSPEEAYSKSVALTSHEPDDGHTQAHPSPRQVPLPEKCRSPWCGLLSLAAACSRPHIADLGSLR